MIIDGQSVKLSVINQETKLSELVLKCLSDKTPFRLYSKQHKGVYINPRNLSYFDSDNNQLMKCQTGEQLNWVIECSLIIYDQIEVAPVLLNQNPIKGMLGL